MNGKINNLIIKNNGAHNILNPQGFVDFQEEKESRELLEHFVYANKFLVETEHPNKKTHRDNDFV